MTPNLGESQSLWMSDTDMPPNGDLRDDISVDVCIIGAGIAGVVTAYLLTQQGLKVCILEESRLGCGQTGRTTAQFTVALDRRYFELEKLHGIEGVKLAAESHGAAIRKTLEIVERERIDCDISLVDGYLFRTFADPSDILYRELEACQRAGLKNTVVVNQGPYSFFKTGPCLMFPQQLQLHPLKYIKGLVQLLHLSGVKIYEQTPAVKVEDGEHPRVTTRRGNVIQARHVVVATHSPINDLVKMHTKMAPYRTYVIAAEIPKGSVPAALCWDTLDPYHYVRIEQDPIDMTSRGVEEVPNVESTDRLVVGGEDHKTGQSVRPEDCFARLETWTRRRFPMVSEISSAWSGQIMEPMDGLAFLGKNPGGKNVWIITGDSGNGTTHATIGAMIICDGICGQKNKWAALYNPSRINLRATGRYIRENANAVLQLARRLVPSDLKDFHQIAMGSGAVIDHRGEKLAIFRDEKGDYHCHSAVCPHMGCVVTWNSVEKSWDCPCHGSRFTSRGQVIEGPAARDIPPREWSF